MISNETLEKLAKQYQTGIIIRDFNRALEAELNRQTA